MENGLLKKMRICRIIGSCLGMILVFGLLAMAPFSYAQDADSQEVVKTVSGTVQNVDWVGGKLVVDTNDYGNADEVVFIVPDDAEIVSGSDTINLTAIEQGDQVQVQFVSTLRGLIVKRIVDQNTLNDTV